MTDITTRAACAADVREIVKMIALLSEHHGDTARISAESLIFLCFCPTPWLSLIVAEQSDEIVGYAALQRKIQLQFAHRLMDVQHLFVKPHARGRGAGRALMEAACNAAWLHRCSGVTLGVMGHNKEAQEFYKSIGFVERETSDAIQMMCDLDLRAPRAAP